MTYRDIADEYAIDALNIGEVINELSAQINNLPENEKLNVKERITTLQECKARLEENAKMYAEKARKARFKDGL